jgi:Na+/H+-dicarboxylate symporter
MRIKLTTWIGLALVLGIAVGYACNTMIPDPAEAKAVAGYFSIVTDIFLRLIRMIIAPLVFSTLVVGIAKMGDAKSIGRVGAKTLLWFLGASFVSLLLGTALVSVLQPGAGLNLPLPEGHAQTGLQTGALNVRDFITHLVPRSVIEAMATNEILQIIVFALFFAMALIAVGERGRRLLELADDMVHVMLRLTGYVMQFAPLAVFAAIASVITTQGLGVLVTYGAFVGEFYGALVLLWLLLFAAGFVVVGPRVFHLVGLIRVPAMLAFSTASSESAFPKLLENLERFGVSERLTSFVLPLGYSFNLDGSMMYCSFASIFIAQAYGIQLTFGQLATMLAILMLTSKGMAAVPKAALVVIAATLAQFHIPEVGLLIIMGVDTFLDMGRTATNVVGNSIATAVVAKWEGELRAGVSEDAPIETVIAEAS